MSTWARTRLRRAALSTLAAVVTGGVAARLGFEANRLRLSRGTQVSAGQAAVPVFARQSSQSLAKLMAKRVHTLVIGPSGCGKTTAVLDAARASASSGGAILLPFYVNLEEVFAASAGVRPAADSESCECVMAAFAAEARAFESNLLRVLSDDFVSWAWVKLSKLLPDGLSTASLTALRQVISPLPPEQEASLYGMLSHLAQAGTQQATLRDYAHGMLDHRQLVPVIIIDEVHVLNEPALEPILRDLLRFVHKHVNAKRAAAVTIVLLSSDAYAAETVGTWGRVSRRLRTMRLGDLHDSELSPFLSFLADTISNQDAAARFRALWATEPQLEALRKRYGGYVSDLVALRDAVDTPGHALTGEAALAQVTDTSPVAALANAPHVASALDALSLQPHAVAAVFTAITTSGVSPRGAVPLESLIAAGVSPAAVHAMRAANLVELRHGNRVDACEYEELTLFGGKPYVCAPCPLARESMACVTERLRAEGAWKNWARVWWSGEGRAQARKAAQEALAAAASAKAAAAGAPPVGR